MKIFLQLSYTDITCLYFDLESPSTLVSKWHKSVVCLISYIALPASFTCMQHQSSGNYSEVTRQEQIVYTLLQNIAYCIPSESCKSYKMVQYITYVWAAVHLNLNL